MNLEFVRQVSRDNPTWLPTNLGSTCYAHTAELVRRIRAAGHEAFFVCKMEGEGGVVPPGFTPRVVRGFDNKGYTISRVSHDVVFFREAGTATLRQFDTLVAANEHERPIYRRDGEPNWSFDPNDGPQIRSSPTWNEVTSNFWRPWNPPLDGEIGDVLPGPGPTPPAPTPAPTRGFRFPSYAELGDDGFFRSAIGVPLQEDASYAGEALNDGSAVWFSRATYRLMAAIIRHQLGEGPAPDPAAEVREVRAQWRAIMQQNHPGLLFPPL